MTDEIRKLLQEVVTKRLNAEKMGTPTQEGDEKRKKGGNVIDQLIAVDKNDTEKEKIEVERLKVENERRKIDLDEKKFEAEIELEKRKLDIEEDKIELEREKLEAEKTTTETKSKWDFLARVATGGLTLVGTIVGVLFLNRWTKWGFMQEEFGSIAGKTMGNVMRQWSLKRA